MLLCTIDVIKSHQMTPLIRKFELYCQQVLGIKTEAVAWNNAAGLPLYLREAYDFYEVDLKKKTFLLASDKKREERPPAALQKQLAQLEQRASLPVVYMRPKITSHNRHRLIVHQVPFVIPGNQLYLPMFCIDLRERFGEEPEVRAVMSPSTQALMLHVLHTGATVPMNPGEMARRLHYTPMTMTRAFAELQQLGIGEQIAKKKNRQLTIGMKGKELWEKAMPLMRTPVRARIYVEQAGLREKMNKAGLTALALYSMIAKPAIPAYACAIERWREIRKDLKVVPVADSGVNQVEVWTYRPELFAAQGIVDRLSLYLSLQDEDDERTTAALEAMMEEIQW